MSTISVDAKKLVVAKDKYEALMATFAIFRDIDSSGNLSPGQTSKMFSGLKKLEAYSRGVNIFDGIPELDNFPRFPPTDESAKVATKFFGIAEICEYVLRHLDAADLRRVQQAAPVFADTIKTSVKLQDVLCLQPAAQHNFFTSFSKGRFPYLTVEGNIRRDRGPTTSVQLTAKFDVDKAKGRNRLLRLGSASSNMLICQPPIHLVEARLSCCRDDTVAGGFHVISATGITVGDLHEASKRFMAAHELCPHASPEELDSDHLVQVRVHFTGVVQICRRDPMAKQERARRRALEAKRRAAYSHNVKMAMFTVGKLMAHESGQKIPTFEEWWSAKQEAYEDYLEESPYEEAQGLDLEGSKEDDE